MERKAYALDSSAIIHLAAREKTHTNSFRLSVTLTEPVCPSTLQTALNHIAPRFPAIVAGIRRGACQYTVVPAETPPEVQPDREYLAYMPDHMIENCALRVLYGERRISVEIFHALTDGYGGMAFLKALLREYLLLARGIACPHKIQAPSDRELADDYITYAEGTSVPIRPRKIYRLPGKALPGETVRITTAIYDLRELLNAAHSCHVSLTAFLTAVLAASMAEMQAESAPSGKRWPVQIMVPVDLRRKFKSESLRNFSLYALPCVEPEQFGLPFPALAAEISRQMERQLTKERLAGMMAASVKLQNMPLIRSAPLGLKEALLHWGHSCCETSCLTLSNLGEITFPPELQPYIERAECMLTPRKKSPYNCGAASYRGKLYFHFSRRCENAELERRFFRRLAAMGCKAVFEVDGRPAGRGSHPEPFSPWSGPPDKKRALCGAV